MVLIAGFPAGSWAANCYVVATGSGTECVVVDPGQDAAPGIADIVREHHLKPVAVLLTHGHVDHMWSVTPVAGTYDATAWIHPADRHLLADPMAGISRESASMLLGGRYEFAEPERVEELVDGARLDLAGLTFTIAHTPGHTPGSVLFEVMTDEDRPGLVVTGDTLFATSIGRTDLPGGDPAAMQRSLIDKVLPLPDDAIVLPGHGPETTIGTERATNPWLADLASGRLATE